jgi:hypothetical protein
MTIDELQLEPAPMATTEDERPLQKWSGLVA